MQNYSWTPSSFVKKLITNPKTIFTIYENGLCQFWKYTPEVVNNIIIFNLQTEIFIHFIVWFAIVVNLILDFILHQRYLFNKLQLIVYFQHSKITNDLNQK